MYKQRAAAVNIDALMPSSVAPRRWPRSVPWRLLISDSDTAVARALGGYGESGGARIARDCRTTGREP